MAAHPQVHEHYLSPPEEKKYLSEIQKAWDCQENFCRLFTNNGHDRNSSSFFFVIGRSETSHSETLVTCHEVVRPLPADLENHSQGKRFAKNFEYLNNDKGAYKAVVALGAFNRGHIIPKSQCSDLDPLQYSLAMHVPLNVVLQLATANRYNTKCVEGEIEKLANKCQASQEQASQERIIVFSSVVGSNNIANSNLKVSKWFVKIVFTLRRDGIVTVLQDCKVVMISNYIPGDSPDIDSSRRECLAVGFEEPPSTWQIKKVSTCPCADVGKVCYFSDIRDYFAWLVLEHPESVIPADVSRLLSDLDPNRYDGIETVLPFVRQPMNPGHLEEVLRTLQKGDDCTYPNLRHLEQRFSGRDLNDSELLILEDALLLFYIKAKKNTYLPVEEIRADSYISLQHDIKGAVTCSTDRWSKVHIRRGDTGFIHAALYTGTGKTDQMDRMPDVIFVKLARYAGPLTLKDSCFPVSFEDMHIPARPPKPIVSD